MAAKASYTVHKQLPEIRLSSKAIVLKQPIKKIRINSNNSISPEFHPATKPLTVEPVDSGNEIVPVIDLSMIIDNSLITEVCIYDENLTCVDFSSIISGAGNPEDGAAA